MKKILYISIIFIIYKIIKSKSNKFNIVESINHIKNIRNIKKNKYESDSDTESECESKNEVEYKSNNENIKENIMKNIIPIQSTIISVNEKNIELINDKKLYYDISTKANYLYKIICELDCENIDNIEIIIKDSEDNNFKYNMKENILYDDEIKKYKFILDNNIFSEKDDKKIDFYLYFYKKNENENSIINNITFEVIEKELLKKNSSIVIIDINNINYPLLTDISNILDYKYDNNDNDYFFI
jgi:hypothetical protein